ncbi:MAG TPA: hypothetical protein VFR19_06725 [Hyphomicrobiaceae bacterium]|jgi:hypothetical protein|nr:hypothetical protein [Hyphomicrobiaceae bacterium]
MTSNAHQSTGRLLALAAGLCLLLPQLGLGQEKSIQVDWQNPEIAAFVRDRAANPPLSVGPGSADEVKLARLKLPVLAFDTPPATASNAFSTGARPQLERTIITDEAEPVWYQIVDRYGDMTITVEADLRVQHQFPSNYPIYGPSSQGAAVEPQVSVFDERTEEGMEGAIAEYTVYKFGQVPYKVTIECTQRNKAQCKDIAVISRDKDLLKLISARPPQ